jgi:hypothetical protein
MHCAHPYPFWVHACLGTTRSMSREIAWFHLVYPRPKGTPTYDGFTTMIVEEIIHTSSSLILLSSLSHSFTNRPLARALDSRVLVIIAINGRNLLCAPFLPVLPHLRAISSKKERHEFSFSSVHYHVHFVRDNTCTMTWHLCTALLRVIYLQVDSKTKLSEPKHWYLSKDKFE